MRKLHSRLIAGFTMVEMMVTCGIAAMVGYAGYSILNVGLLLFAKNSAINTSHQQARTALFRMENDFHSSASQVQLTDANGVPLPASCGPEPGVSFQTMCGGPFLVTMSANKGQNTIRANFGTMQPELGHRLLIPLHRVEADIVGVAGSGPEYTVTLDRALPRAVTATFTGASGTLNANVQCFLTERVFYTVKAKRLVRWKSTNATPKVLATGVISDTPFRLNVGVNGVFDRKMVTAVDLATCDPSTNNLGFRSANIMLNATVPVRQRLAEHL